MSFDLKPLVEFVSKAVWFGIFFVKKLFKKKKKYIYIYIFDCSESSLLCSGFLLLQRAGVSLCCSAWASNCGVFSPCRARALDVLWLAGALEHRFSSCGV